MNSILNAVISFAFLLFFYFILGLPNFASTIYCFLIWIILNQLDIITYLKDSEKEVKEKENGKKRKD